MVTCTSSISEVIESWSTLITSSSIGPRFTRTLASQHLTHTRDATDRVTITSCNTNIPERLLFYTPETLPTGSQSQAVIQIYQKGCYFTHQRHYHRITITSCNTNIPERLLFYTPETLPTGSQSQAVIQIYQ